MIRHGIVGLFVLVAQTVMGELPAHVRADLNSAVSSPGTAYVAIRNNLVSLGSNALPELVHVGANTNASWQIRLMANIVVERIQRGGEISALVEIGSEGRLQRPPC